MLSEESTASRESAGDDGSEGVGGTAGAVTGADRSADAGADAGSDVGADASCDAGCDVGVDGGGAGSDARRDAGGDASADAIGDASASSRQAVENSEVTTINVVDTTRLERCIKAMTLAPRPAQDMPKRCTMCTPQ
jgi:hypothetical protein